MDQSLRIDAQGKYGTSNSLLKKAGCMAGHSREDGMSGLCFFESFFMIFFIMPT